MVLVCDAKPATYRLNETGQISKTNMTDSLALQYINLSALLQG